MMPETGHESPEADFRTASGDGRLDGIVVILPVVYADRKRSLLTTSDMNMYR